MWQNVNDPKYPDNDYDNRPTIYDKHIQLLTKKQILFPKNLFFDE